MSQPTDDDVILDRASDDLEHHRLAIWGDSLRRNGEVVQTTEAEVVFDIEIQIDSRQQTTERHIPNECAICQSSLPRNFRRALLETPLSTRDQYEWVDSQSHKIVNCHRCKGRGEVSCEWCDGTGHSQCILCQGKGNRPLKQDCSNCDGSGELQDQQCSECDGDGLELIARECGECLGLGNMALLKSSVGDRF